MHSNQEVILHGRVRGQCIGMGGVSAPLKGVPSVPGEGRIYAPTLIPSGKCLRPAQLL